jgi:hypothetical protein
MEIPKTLIDFLNQSKIPYEILHHPEAFTAQTIARLLFHLGGAVT